MNRLSIAFGALVFSMPVATFAQDVPGAQVAGGFAYLISPDAILVQPLSDEKPGTSSTEGGTAKGPGWFGEIIGNITPHAGIVGQVSATHTTGTLNSRAWTGRDRAYTVLGGPRFSSRCCQGVVPFAQVLLGFVRTNADVTVGLNKVTQFTDYYSAFTAGGGADIRTGGAVGIHLGADLMRTSRGHGADDFGLTWRVQTGLIVPMR